MSVISQSEFHPMRGHVADGVEVAMDNGDCLTLRASMAGWIIDGPRGLVEMSGAAEIEHYIVTYR